MVQSSDFLQSVYNKVKFNDIPMEIVADLQPGSPFPLS